MNEILLVVDMQKGFVKPCCRHIVSPIIQLVQHFSCQGRQVAFTQFVNTAGSNFERILRWDRLKEERDTAIIPELAPYLLNIFQKNYYSPFTPDFEDFLHGANASRIFICGIATESCVLKAAMDSFERGLHPVVVKDAVFSHAGEMHHQAGLLILERNIGKQQLQTVQEVIENKKGLTQE